MPHNYKSRNARARELMRNSHSVAGYFSVNVATGTAASDSLSQQQQEEEEEDAPPAEAVEPNDNINAENSGRDLTVPHGHFLRGVSLGFGCGTILWPNYHRNLNVSALTQSAYLRKVLLRLLDHWRHTMRRHPVQQRTAVGRGFTGVLSRSSQCVCKSMKCLCGEILFN